MLFNSLHYFLFAPAVIAIYFVLPAKAQRIWLLAVSMYFYAVFRVPFTLLLLFSIICTHFAVVMMARSKGDSVRRFFLFLAIAANASILYFFKFIDFSFDVYNRLFFLEPCDDWYADPTGVVLPMGISFFTLQAIAYAVDVYRGTIPAGRSIFSFSLFLSFFPQLVAGPIMRAKDLLHQFGEEHRFQFENFRAGTSLIILGLFKKTIVADPAGTIVDPIFADPGRFSWEYLWVAVFLHALQIYGDFSGYSDIAIGTGRIMGFRIPENFHRPFLAVDMGDMWRRWHISLSSWLRDYVYIPLGGGRVSLPRQYFNIFTTMFVSGIWHGAGLNFVLWGSFHALVVVIERFILSFPRIGALYKDGLPRPIKVFYTFVMFSFALFFFRARAVPGIGDAADVGWMMVGRALSFAGGEGLYIAPGILLPIFVLMGAEMIQEKREDFFQPMLKNNFIFWTTAGIVLGYCLLLYSVTDSAPFVYFQF